MDDLIPMSLAEARHLRDLAEAWKTYGPAARAKLQMDGGMTWKTVNGGHYLCRYRLSRSGLHWEELDEDISIAGLIAGRGDMTRRTEQAAE